MNLLGFDRTPCPSPHFLTAFGRGQDRRGRRRSATIPLSRLSWENVANHGQRWQHVRTQSKIWQKAGDLWPICENPVCPDLL